MDLENCCVGEIFPSLVQDRRWNFRAVRQSKGAKIEYLATQNE
jgi:hypothetical protein